jgi:tRNA-dihydrouridine synthase
VTIHGRTAEQSYKRSADWTLVTGIAGDLDIPVFGSGDCIEPHQIIEKLHQVAPGATPASAVFWLDAACLRNPWILSQAADIAEGRTPRQVTMDDRRRFLLDYIDLLVRERVDEAEGFVTRCREMKSRQTTHGRRADANVG